MKGGHLDGEAVEEGVVVDTLVRAAGAGGGESESTVDRFETPRIDTDATHGSGCALSSAIAARLARGESVRGAVGAAVEEMTEAVRRGYDVGEGPGAVNPTVLGEE